MPEKELVQVGSGEMAANAMDVAQKALEKIAEHERTCGTRWTETRDSLARVTLSQEVHAKRWEKLAWMVGACSLALTVATLTG
tara:strand:- start:2696 stop:2944 length:249 start_codon:yes stop_codon:yes gene_type:complete